MPTVRLLSPDEYSLWDSLVASSPQASIFHTSAWNEMLCATGEPGHAWLTLVCEEKKSLQAGVSLHYVARGAKKQAISPSLGYGGPILGPQFEYGKLDHTYHSYKTIKELLSEIEHLVDCVVIQNQPEIWDSRPYKFQDWKVNTAYLHVLDCKNPAEWWSTIDAGLQTQITSTSESMTFTTTPAEGLVRKFSSLAAQPARLFAPDQSRRAATFEKRIRWMLEKDLCRLVTLKDRRGKEQAISLLILSRENRTIYVWKTVYLAGKRELEILPALARHICFDHAEGFDRIDLGESATQAVSQLKDRLGGKLTPRFIAEFNK